jgi:hypothetical protein
MEVHLLLEFLDSIVDLGTYKVGYMPMHVF